ncbi:hypothetical protein [Streptomyces xanthii]|uniref:Uncharacterized protein n=1 Tax=Streptomyces xanthii TaxID=2768069 RepID=A0A7H1BAS5_9ACTN|nr:hypothetical protein [Streptomyces xanthii]QNS05830.1 hypothetical protein IAG42_21070 [Streptomyces xanthii]
MGAAMMPIVGAVALTAFGAGQAQAASSFYKCDKPSMSAAKKKVTSYCYKISSVGGKKASKHRAKALCDQDRGSGPFIHSVQVTVHGPWVALGKKSSVTCPLRSTLIMGYSEKK